MGSSLANASVAQLVEQQTLNLFVHGSSPCRGTILWPTAFFLHQPPDILLFIGRFHPLLVHLPIGMLTALAALEIAALRPRFRNAAASAGYLLALAAPLAVVTAGCGRRFLLRCLVGDGQSMIKLAFALS